MSTSSAATCQHFPAGLGCHSGAKAVTALALEYAGLKCTLHDTNLPNGFWLARYGSKRFGRIEPIRFRARIIGVAEGLGKTQAEARRWFKAAREK